ncbi:YaeQ family protein [Gammaproteobacteria bacterium AS21]|jgi:uncharacterized protein YaeQ
MALKPTLYKVDLQLVDTDRDVYENCKFTLTQHPSETQTRMMVRLMVFGLNYHPNLKFTKGLSSQDEPDIWQVSDNLEIDRWIEVGQASPERMRKGISRSRDVCLYAYGSDADVWWQKNSEAYTALPKMSVYQFDHQQLASLTQLAQRKMALTLTISSGELFINCGDDNVHLALIKLL